MNECEYCEADFPNITELYRHKYRFHKKQSLALHNHPQPKETMDIVPAYELDSEPDIKLGEKRKRDDLDSHDSKRYKSLPEASNRIVTVAKPRKIKPKRKFYQVETPRPLVPIEEDKPLAIESAANFDVIEASKNSNNSGNQVVSATDKPIEIIPPKEYIDYKEYYEKCVAELKAREETFKQQILKIRKECGQDIIKIKKKFKKKEQSLKKELSSQKNFYEEKTKEMEDFYDKTTVMLKEKINSMEEDKASFKPLSDAIFNCITIEEIFKIKTLLKQHKIEQVIEKHLDTLQKLFLSLSYGVIPICQPQRDIISDFQKNLIEKIETSPPDQVEKLVSNNRMEIIKIFSIIEQSIQLATDSYKKFVKA